MVDIHVVIPEAEKITIYKDGKTKHFFKSDEKFLKIMREWKAMTQTAFQMPAFGVSFDNLTREEMKSGLWIEFEFDGERVEWGMPFSKLLVCVREDFYGFNIVRYTEKDGYTGRCYYLDLKGKSMKHFYNIVLGVLA